VKKVPNLFERDWNGDKSKVLPQLHGGADVAWVLEGHGNPTVKWDGSACLIKDGVLFVRYDAKRGKKPPPGFMPAQEPDEKTGHHPGWIPSDGPAAKWHVMALINSDPMVDSHPHRSSLDDGTYEAVGPHHQSNPYSFDNDILLRHGTHHLPQRFPADFPSVRSAFNWLRHFLTEYRFAIMGMPAAMGIEGIVWHHESGDGRMVKVLSSDLGVTWRAKPR
jgi:hypothetical protein